MGFRTDSCVVMFKAVFFLFYGCPSVCLPMIRFTLESRCVLGNYLGLPNSLTVFLTIVIPLVTWLPHAVSTSCNILHPLTCGWNLTVTLNLCHVLVSQTMKLYRALFFSSIYISQIFLLHTHAAQGVTCMMKVESSHPSCIKSLIT